MVSFNRALLLLGFALATSQVVAQSLQDCAQKCVQVTRTKCKNTDFKCACTDKKYLPKLTKCISNFCDDTAKAEADLYLTQLCHSVGVDLKQQQLPKKQEERVEIRYAAPITTPKPTPVHFIERQDISFAQSEVIFSDYLSSILDDISRSLAFTDEFTRSLPTSTPAETTGASGNEFGGGGGGGGSKKKSGFGSGAKIGVGVAIPLALGLLAGLIVLVKRLRTKKHVPNAPGEAGVQPQMGQPQMGQPQTMHAQMGQAPTPASGHAELSQNASYTGHELPTKGGNTFEMAVPAHQQGYASPPIPGAYTVHGQQQQQPQLYPPQQQHYPQPGAQSPQWTTPPPGQQWTTPPPGYQSPPPGQGQQQAYYPPPGQQGQYVQPHYGATVGELSGMQSPQPGQAVPQGQPQEMPLGPGSPPPGNVQRP